MFEQRLNNLSKAFSCEKAKKFYRLTHKKHRREIYFQNTTETIAFMKFKFNSPFKRLAHFFIRHGLLQPFLKTVNLPESLGEVIFVGGQIKGFHLKEKTVLSFPLRRVERNFFLHSKREQIKASKKGFAPRIAELNTTIPFCKEELVIPHTPKSPREIFQRLLLYYQKEGIRKTTLNSYHKKLQNMFSSEEEKKFLEKTMRRIRSTYLGETPLYLVSLHGDFAQEQVLQRENTILFGDWVGGKGPILNDLIHFFRERADIVSIPAFRELLRIYPREVQEKVLLYLLLADLSFIARRPALAPFLENRIKHLLMQLP